LAGRAIYEISLVPDAQVNVFENHEPTTDNYQLTTDNQKYFIRLKRIGLISDTHGWLDDAVFRHFSEVDEIWHAGDFGTPELASRLSDFKPLKGVYGNIDGPDIRRRFPESLVWTCEGIKVAMIHIGGYPGKYSQEGKTLIRDEKPGLFITGHSHILKIQYDKAHSCLHINPGAAGRQGWHKVCTLVRITIDQADIRDAEVVEFSKSTGGGEGG
jgi:putative phosphoesterase